MKRNVSPKKPRLDRTNEPPMQERRNFDDCGDPSNVHNLLVAEVSEFLIVFSSMGALQLTGVNGTSLLRIIVSRSIVTVVRQKRCNGA